MRKLIEAAAIAASTFVAGYLRRPAPTDKVVLEAAPRPPGIPHT